MGYTKFILSLEKKPPAQKCQGLLVTVFALAFSVSRILGYCSSFSGIVPLRLVP